MRRCKCGAVTPLARPNRYGVRMPSRWCGACQPSPRLRHDHHYRSTIVLGPAACRDCGAPVWYDRLGWRWLDADRRGHACAGRAAA